MQYQLPPWMVQEAPFGRSLLQGAQVGSQMKRNFMEAQRLSEESAREQAMMPLKMAAMNNQIKAAAIDLEVGMIKQQDMIQNKQAFSELSRAAADISAGAAWAQPESEKRIWEIAAANPSVVGTPEFQGIVRQFDVAGAAAIKAKEAENRATKITGDLGIAQQRIELGRETIASKEAMLQEQIKSNEKIAGEKNTALIEAAKLRAQAQARDVLPDALYRQFSEIVGAIADSKEFQNVAAKESAMNRAFERFREQVRQMKGKDDSNDLIPVRAPNGQTGKIPRSQLESALKAGYTSLTNSPSLRR